MRPAALRRGLVAFALGLCSLATATAAFALTEAQSRGKQIYLTGESASGSDVSALVGTEGVALPASAAPCANCHGPDGPGRPEGGLLPPDIRWSQLTKIYGHVHENGRRHPKFDAQKVAHVLRTGLDPAGNQLDRGMPMYQMSDEDMSDLIAYLKYLENDRDPGLADDSVQVATLLPLRGSHGRLGQAMAQVMLGHFKDINDGGGIYGRRIELLAIPFEATREATLDSLRKALRVEGVFALVGAYTIGLDDQVLEVLRTEQVPLVGPFTLDPGDQLENDAVFYLYSGFDEQARVLVDHALEGPGARPDSVLVIGPEGARSNRLVKAISDQVAKRKGKSPQVLRYETGTFDAAAVAAQVRDRATQSVIFVGGQAGMDAMLAGLDGIGVYPRMYFLSSFVAKPPFEAPAGFNGQLFVAFPTMARDIDEQGRAAYAQLAQRHGLPPDHVQAQMGAYAAAKLLEEGMRRAGSKLDRRALVEGIEALYAFKTGVTPPLTYGPNRRIGALGAHVVTVDLIKRSYEPVGGWRELR